MKITAMITLAVIGLGVLTGCASASDPDYGGDHREIETEAWIHMAKSWKLPYVVLESEPDGWVDEAESYLVDAARDHPEDRPMTALDNKPQRPKPGLGPQYRHRTMDVRYGEDPVLEIVALELLMSERRKGPTAIDAKKFWLTPDQLDMRRKREVLNKNGVPDSALIVGIYGRAYNPMMGRRPRKNQNIYQDSAPAFEGRLSDLSLVANNGWTEPWCPVKSAWWADHGTHHLDRYQRSRIRRAYWSAGSDRLAVKAQLAEKYGVPPWVISRVAISSRNCNT